MSLNPLKIATDGYLKRTTKAVLIIAVAGYLNFGGGPIPPTPISPSGNSAGSIGTAFKQIDKEELKKIRKRILKDDEELLFFIVKAIPKIIN